MRVDEQRDLLMEALKAIAFSYGPETVGDVRRYARQALEQAEGFKLTLDDLALSVRGYWAVQSMMQKKQLLTAQDLANLERAPNWGNSGIGMKVARELYDRLLEAGLTPRWTPPVLKYGLLATPKK